MQAPKSDDMPCRPGQATMPMLRPRETNGHSDMEPSPKARRKPKSSHNMAPRPNGLPDRAPSHSRLEEPKPSHSRELQSRCHKHPDLPRPYSSGASFDKRARC